jgi:Na+/melibiose symporter-like transporter
MSHPDDGLLDYRTPAPAKRLGCLWRGVGVVAGVLVAAGVCVVLIVMFGDRPGDNAGTEQAIFFCGFPVLCVVFSLLMLLALSRWISPR